MTLQGTSRLGTRQSLIDMKLPGVHHTSIELLKYRASSQYTTMRPHKAHLPQVWTTRLLANDKCNTPCGGLKHVHTSFEVSGLNVLTVTHHGLGAANGNCGFSANIVINFRAQQLLISNSFHSMKAIAGLYSEWYPHSLWAPNNWCMDVIVQI